MAPATTSRATAAQAQQLLDVLRDLSSDQFQRLLANGDLLKLVAKVPQNEESARMLRQYASGYVDLTAYYQVHSWDALKKWTHYARSWCVLHNGQYVPMLEHYGLHYADQGHRREVMERGIRAHWMDYQKWYVRVA